MSDLYFKGRVVLPDGISDKGVLVRDGKVLDAALSYPTADAEIIDAGSGYVLPGFIDMHVHGGGGYDFMGGSAEAIVEAARAHCRCGTTAIYPTTMSCHMDVLYHFFDCYRDAMKLDCGADLMGIHMEGPYFGPGHSGAQNPELLRHPTPEETTEILSRGGNLVKRISLAPELPGTEGIVRTMKERGILVASAHSDADFDELSASIPWGLSHLTHFYNVTTMYHKKNQKVHGGIVEAGFYYDDLTLELIGDGHHIPQEIMLLCCKLKGYDHVALITDSMRAAGTDAKESFLGSLQERWPVIIDDGVAKLPDKTRFAGSIATADRLWKIAHLKYGIPLVDVCNMMSETPAKIMGIQEQKGGIKAGHDADIVVVSDKFDVKGVWVRGNRKV